MSAQEPAAVEHVKAYRVSPWKLSHSAFQCFDHTIPPGWSATQKLRIHLCSDAEAD